MPLFINELKQDVLPSSTEELFEKFPYLKESCIPLLGQEVRTVGPKKLLYVMQREYAVVSPEDDCIDILGSEDATTCHIVVLRHSGSGVTGLAHFDGSDTNTGVEQMTKKLMERCIGAPEGRLELHVIGGFRDDKQDSQDLSLELLGSFIKLEEDIHLLTACISELNDTVRGHYHFPVIYGIAVEIKTGEIYRATFEDKGPDQSIRSAAVFTGWRKMMDIYDAQLKLLTIGPLQWEPFENIDIWVSLPDSFIRQVAPISNLSKDFKKQEIPEARQHLSTSPEQEPDDFVQHVRQSLLTIQQHPDPSQTIFRDNKARVYNKQPDGQWTRV